METITIPNTHTEDSHYNPCTEIAVGTSLDLNRTISGTPPNTSSLSLWFKIEESAILKLGTANDCLQIASDGMALVADGTKNSNFQKDSSDIAATAGNWHHLAWIKNNDQHTLYLNGIACQTQTLAGAPNPATIDTITSVGANAYVVHLHGYDRALEATEVVADKMSQYNATKSFTDQYPLNFTLKNRSAALEMSDDKLIIEDITAKERTYQRLVITNVSGEALRFVERTGEVSNTNYHFELRFRNGTFVSPSEYPKFDNFKTENLLEGEPSGIPSGWQATLPYQHPQDGSWSVYVLRTAALDLDPNERLEFPFEYTTADGSLGGRSTRVSLRYNHIQYAYTSYNQWQPTKAYTAGSYVFYEQVLYKAKQDTDTNAAWNTEHWENMTWQDINAYTAGDVVVKESGVYMAKDRISAESWNETQWQLLDLIQGIREKQIDIINNSSNNAHVSALNQKVTAADERTDALEKQSNKAVDDLDSLFDSFFSEESEVADKDGNLVANPIKAAKDEAATAKSDAATAKEAAETAQAAANAAEVAAAKEKGEAEAAKKAAVDAQTKAVDAQTKAVEAKEAAAKEKGEAKAAKTAAVDAQTKADKAKEAAEAAVQAAINGGAEEKRKAEAAKTAAEAAQAAANEAKKAAERESKEAKDAKKAAETAQNAAEQAKQDLLDAASGTDRQIGFSDGKDRSGSRVQEPSTISNGTLGEFFTGVINTFKTLSANIKAVDDEVDERARLHKEMESKLEKPFPLVASVSAPEGVVCGDSGTSLQFKLTNIGSEAVSFNSNSEFRFILPKGTDSADLVTDDNKAGNGNNGLEKSSSGSSSNTVVFTWDPPSGREIAPRTSETFTISGITPNSKVGFVTIFIEYQGIVGYPSGKLSVAVSKVSKDIAQLVGGGNVGIGTTNPEYKLDFGTQSVSTIRMVSENNGTAIRIGAGNNDINLLRVDASTTGNTDDAYYGFSLRYMGSRIGNDNSLSVFSDNQQGTQVEALTIIQDGNVGIGTNDPGAKLEVNGTAKVTNLKIGSIEIGEDELNILKKLADGELTVNIESKVKSGYYLDHYYGRGAGGDSNRSVQFKSGKTNNNTKFKLNIED